MTHDEWIGEIMQAVAAAQGGNNQPLHHLASMLMAQEDAGSPVPQADFLAALDDQDRQALEQEAADREPTDAELDEEEAQAQWGTAEADDAR